MSVAKTTYYDFQGKTGTKWRVSIIDTSSSASTTNTVNPTNDGFSMDWQGDTETGYTPIVSSQMSFSLYLDDVVRELVDAIITSAENTFVVQIQKFNITWIRQWTGFIVRDEIILPDAGVANLTETIEFTAVDGFGLLEDVEYTGFTPGSLTRVRVTDFICDQIMAIMPAGKLSLSTAVIGQASVWYETQMASTPADDPLYNTYINEAAFVEVDEYGVTKGLPLLDCLRHILDTFMLELRQWNGVHLLIQQNTYTQTTTRVWYYNLDGTYNSTALINLQETMKDRAPGGSFQYLLPVKEVNTKYNYKAGIYSNNLLPNTITESTTYTLGTFSLSDVINFNGTFRVVFSIDTADGGWYWMRHKIVIQNGTHYLKKGTGSTLTWTTDSSDFIFIYTAFQCDAVSTSVQIPCPFNFDTPPIPESDQTVTFEWEFIDATTTNVTIIETDGGIYSGCKCVATLVTGDLMEGSIFYKSTLSNGALQNLELEETVLGDGWNKYSAGAFWVVDSLTNIVPSDLWTTYGEIGGTGLPVNTLRCREAMSQRRDIVTLYEGTFYGNPDIHKGFAWNNYYWIWVNVNWNANACEFSGTAMRLNPTPDDIVNATPAPEEEQTSSPSGGSSSTEGSTVNEQYWKRTGTLLEPATAGDDVQTSGNLIARTSNIKYSVVRPAGFASIYDTAAPYISTTRYGAGTNNGALNNDAVINIQASTQASDNTGTIVMNDITTATENHTATANGVKREIKTIRNTTRVLKSRILIDGDGYIIINEDGEPTGFRIEGDTDSNLFYVDGVNDRVGVGVAAPAVKFDVRVPSGDFARIGDGTNYTQIAENGHMTLVGTATVWEDLRIEPVVRAGAGNIPAFEVWRTDSEGLSMGVFLYSFTDVAQAQEKEIHWTAQMPHAWAGTAIYIHVHWMGAVDDTTAAPRWGLEYTWADIGTVFATTSTVYTDGNNYTGGGTDANVTAFKHYISGFAAITPSTSQDGISSVIIGRLFRNSSSALDTYNATGAKCGLLYIDIHYEINSLGSNTEYTK